jgi:hypothetical protein
MRGERSKQKRQGQNRRAQGGKGAKHAVGNIRFPSEIGSNFRLLSQKNREIEIRLDSIQNRS